MVKKIIKKETKKQPKAEPNLLGPSRYIGIAIALLSVILIALTLAIKFGSTQNIDYSKSYLVDKKIATEIKCNDLSNAITGEESFIFVTTLNDENEYKLEKDLKKVIGENRLNDKFYVYVDDPSCGSLSDITTNASINLKLQEKITQVPTILYYKDGSLVDYVERVDKNMIEAADFVQLLDIYELTK